MDDETKLYGVPMKVGHVRVLEALDVTRGRTLQRLDCILMPSEEQITVTVEEGDGKLRGAMDTMRAEIAKRGVALTDVLAPMGNTFGMKAEYLPL